MHRVVPVIPPWAGTLVSQIQSRPQRPGKLPRPQLLPVVAPVLRPTFCTLQLSTGPLVTFRPGTPASLRLQTLGAQPPTQLPSWSCSPGHQAQDTQQRHPQRPLPRTSSKGAPSLCPTLGLGLTWMWAPNQCTEPLLSPSASLPIFHHKPPVPLPQACCPLTSTGPIPHAKWLPRASPTPLHTLISLLPRLASKLWLSRWESSWGQLPLPGSHLSVNGGRLCLAKWDLGPALPPPSLTLGPGKFYPLAPVQATPVSSQD